MPVRQTVAMPSAAYAAARTGSLTLATTVGTEKVSAASWAARMFRLSPSVSAKKRSAPSTPRRRSTSSSVPSPRTALPPESLGQLVERVGPQVDDGDLVARGGEPTGEAGPHPSTAHDDGAHLYLDPSWVRRAAPASSTASRTTMTLQGAFWKT